jgi:nucleoside phosphorylase
MTASERRALILTALPVEYDAVRSYLKDIREEEDTVGTVYEVGKFDAEDSHWSVCLSEVGAGNLGAATQVERAVQHYRPSVAFFVGVAGGIKDVSIGDVVVATRIYGYESGKSTSDNFMPRPEVSEPSRSVSFG